ncbi:MAG: penicillin-binding transpeptidase domain-containing protein [bacterium]|nr:penicillin-binding transpeptidase domain-containing protein [bacterium]
MHRFLKKRRREYQAIEPDEILIDAANLPAFDTARLEGKIERPISPKTFRGFSGIVLFLAIVLVGQLVNLQILRYSAFAVRAEANSLSQTTIIADRGLLTDRNGVLLAGNVAEAEPGLATRVYPLGAAAANLIGYVSYPKRDQNGYWYQDATEGVAGVEAAENDALAGRNGIRIIETDASGESVSGSIVREPRTGSDIRLSIDAELQKELYAEIRTRSEGSGWRGGTGVIMDARTGELLAVASYPSFDPEVMSSGDPTEEVERLRADSRSPFLDRAVSGLYTPGSVVKPFVAVAALESHTISPEKQILSTGSISVPNPYDAAHPFVFKDWRAHGLVDMRHAIAVSSDVYFYEVGGGFEDQPGLGISAIERYMRMFGFGDMTGVPLIGEETGTIPDPEWKANNFAGEPWFLGDTYHTAIGQYGFRVTAMQLARAVAAIANGGTLVTPVTKAGEHGVSTQIPVLDGNLEVVREGMRLSVTEGIAQALAIPGVAVAAKTGTAEVGARNEFTNSLVEGFFPYDNPRYAFAVVMERAPSGTREGAPAIMGRVLSWLVENRYDMITTPN